MAEQNPDDVIRDAVKLTEAEANLERTISAALQAAEQEALSGLNQLFKVFQMNTLLIKQVMSRHLAEIRAMRAALNAPKGPPEPPTDGHSAQQSPAKRPKGVK